MGNPLAIFLAFLRALICFIIMSFLLLLYIPLDKIFKFGTTERNFKLRRFYISLINPILGVRSSIEGQVLNEAALYVCNHRSLSDPLITAAKVDANIIAKAEVAKIPILDSGAKLTGIIYVDREAKSSRSAVREKMVETIKSGTNVLVYPEGTVNPNIELMEYKPGTFIEAAKNNIPVVPIVVEYYSLKDLWYNRKMVAHFFLQFGKLFTKSKMSIGPAFRNEDGIELRDQIMKWSQAKINEIHIGWGSYFESQKTNTNSPT